MIHQKGLVPLLIVILITLAIGGYLIYQKTSKTQPTPLPQQTTQPSPSPTDETANWNVYKNRQYGFEMKFPSDMYVLSDEASKNSIPLGWIGIRSSDFQEDQSLCKGGCNYPIIKGWEVLIAIYPGTTRADPLNRVISSETKSINGVKMQIEEKPRMNQPDDSATNLYAYIFDEKHGNTISIVFSVDQPTKPLFKDRFENILSTFKFIN